MTKIFHKKIILTPLLRYQQNQKSILPKIQQRHQVMR